MSNEDIMFFNDGVRRIDYILAFEPGAYEGEREENRSRKREYYQAELEKEGLQLEFEPIEVRLYEHISKKCNFDPNP